VIFTRNANAVIPVTAARETGLYINRVARTSLVTPWLTKLGDEVADGPQASGGLIFFEA
jgi:hypothetical protein